MDEMSECSFQLDPKTDCNFWYTFGAGPLGKHVSGE